MGCKKPKKDTNKETQIRNTDKIGAPPPINRPQPEHRGPWAPFDTGRKY